MLTDHWIWLMSPQMFLQWSFYKLLLRFVRLLCGRIPRHWGSHGPRSVWGDGVWGSLWLRDLWPERTFHWRQTHWLSCPLTSILRYCMSPHPPLPFSDADINSLHRRHLPYSLNNQTRLFYFSVGHLPFKPKQLFIAPLIHHIGNLIFNRWVNCCFN